MTGSLTRPLAWRREFARFVAPFAGALRHAHQRRWAAAYLEGLLADGDRKSVEPLAARVAPDDYQQLHHFVSTSPWPVEPLEAVLAETADRLVGGPDAVLVLDDTPLHKQGRHSVGVGSMYCGDIQAKANAQSVVTATLARGDVPVVVGMRLYLPKDWAADAERRRRCGVPDAVAFREHPAMALAEVDRLLALGVRFGCVCADAGYGKGVEFRRALSARGLTWAVTITPRQRAYPGAVTFAHLPRSGRRPYRHPQPFVDGVAVRPTPLPAHIAALGPNAFRRVTWRDGTKGPLAGDFALCRVRLVVPPEGAPAARPFTPPADPEAVWLVCQRLSEAHKRKPRGPDGYEYRYYATNQPATATPEQVVGAIRAGWSCEQAHQQLKGELGLDHYEGRGWRGLHHHLLLTAIAYAFLQHLRLQQTEQTAEPSAELAAGPIVRLPTEPTAKVPVTPLQDVRPSAAPAPEGGGKISPRARRHSSPRPAGRALTPRCAPRTRRRAAGPPAVCPAVPGVSGPRAIAMSSRSPRPTI